MGFQSYLEFLFFSTLSLFTLIGLPLPVSIPPLPDDPALSRIAPRDTMAFVSWNGTAKLSPNSPNKTERLAAVPEVRTLFAQLRAANSAMLGQQMPGPAGLLAKRSFELALTMLQHPGCVFVSDVRRDPRPKLAAGLAVKLGKQLPAARAVMDALTLAMRGLNRGGVDLHEDVDMDGVRFHALPVDQDHGFFGWAVTDDWFLLAIGKDTPAQMVAGLRGTSQGLTQNADYRRLHGASQVARPATRSFVDVQRLLAATELSTPTLRALADALGLGKSTAAMATSGLEGDGFCYRLRVLVPEHAGLLGALNGPPLRQDDLLLIPRDADLAMAMRMDARKLESGILDLFGAFFGDEFRTGYERRGLVEFERSTGLDLRADLLDHLGDQITLWDAPSDGGILFSAAAGVLGLKNRAQFAQSVQALTEKGKQALPSKQRQLAAGGRLRRSDSCIESFEYRDHSVSWLDVMDDDVPFAPAWAVVDDRLMLSCVPQSLRTTIDFAEASNPDESLMRSSRYNSRGKAVAMLHMDMQQLFTHGYPALLMGLQVVGREWQREGFDLDLADVPRLRSILPHLGRELTLLEPTEQGWSLTRTGTLPVADPVLVTLAVTMVSIFGGM